MSAAAITPYLFGGRCEDALNFYRQALGAEVDMMRYSESPEPTPPGALGAVDSSSALTLPHRWPTAPIASDPSSSGAEGRSRGIPLLLAAGA